MEMFNKLKAKLAEELDSETESNAEYGGGDRTAAGAAQGSPADQVRALEAEVRELKEHINKNYFVYVKRLEKRKERIKELEEYAKLVVKDNEALNDKLKELEECQTQLGRARDNLDELEGFQSQELAKVKHMLLSAETALEKETRERKELGERVAKGEREAERLRLETSRREAKWLEKEEGWEARVEEVRREEEAKVQRLQERLSNQDLSGDERLDAVIDERDRMEVELRSAEAECAALQKRLVEANEQAEAAQVESEQAREDLSKMKQEKDALRSSVLELEIANHEHQNSENADINGLKMEVAKLNTEKETLEMTLDLRDRELKAKKEEFRGDLALLESRKSELEQEVDAKSSRVSALEAELTVLKEKLAESSRDLSSVNSKMAVHEERAMQMEEASRNKDESLTSLRSELEEERRSAIGSAEALSELEVRYSEVVADYEKVVIELGDVSKAKAELERSVTEKTSEADNLSDRVRSLEGVIKEQEDSFPERVEATQLVRDLRKQLLEAEDDLADKKKVIKLHGQRIADIKKTMQKEMRAMTTTSPAENGHMSSDGAGGGGGRASSTPTPPPLAAAATGHSPTAASFDAAQLVLSPPPLGRASPPSAGGGSGEIVAMTEVNFKYLKHVIFKFFTSREYEAQHLTRAISALLKFTSDEERLLQEHLEWKMSWFGAKPKLGSGQFSLSIPDSS